VSSTNSGNGTYDVAIIGGGPAGSTASTLLKKYRPDLSVVVLEKEHFPREHIGESQLPGCGHVCYEMGCWDKVERANFPVKVGATFKWGRRNEDWDYNFVDPRALEGLDRPGTFEGPRRQTAFQVDRPVYDKILLDHAAESGVDVRQGELVREVLRSNGRVEGFSLESGETIKARWYIDASGARSVVRRAMGVESHEPNELRNIAIFDRWQNAEWAVKIGVGGTRINVRSLPYGWLWFIPLGQTLTSIGLVCPSAHYKASGKTPEELYVEAIKSEPTIARLTKSATRMGKGATSIKDWSHVAENVIGENWMLVGEAAGFADPILSAGMWNAHSTARDAAYTIMEIDRGEHDEEWLRSRFRTRSKTVVEQYIRFARFWYAANGCFTDLAEYCQKIAAEGGLRMKPEQAWGWIVQGGFTLEEVVKPGVGSFDIFSAKDLIEDFLGEEVQRAVRTYNVFKLNMHNATEGTLGELRDGRIHQLPCLKRGEKTLPLVGYWGTLVQALQQTERITDLVRNIEQGAARLSPRDRSVAVQHYLATLEAMVQDGWVIPKSDKKAPTLKF
jgi:flavin-dependent dehydrogenase